MITNKKLCKQLQTKSSFTDSSGLFLFFIITFDSNSNLSIRTGLDNYGKLSNIQL